MTTPPEAADRLLRQPQSRQPAALRRCTDAELISLAAELAGRQQTSKVRSTSAVVAAEQNSTARRGTSKAGQNR